MLSHLPTEITHLTLAELKDYISSGTWLNSNGLNESDPDISLVSYPRKVVAIDIAGVPLIVKFGTMVSLNEADVTRYVANHTSVPVPAIYHTFVDTDRPLTVTYIIEERLPGHTLQSILTTIGLDDQETISRELADILCQLSTLSGHRTTLGPMDGPWQNSYFTELLEDYPCTVEDARTTRDFIEYFLRVKGYRDPCQPIKTIDESLQPFDLQRAPLFSHGDMGPANIMVAGGHIVGIIDWHEAGWYPYFWEDFVAAGAGCMIPSREGQDNWYAISPNLPVTFLEEMDAFNRIWGNARYYYM
ncbi:uncharacterized protein STEHIDRAFT_142002 [Stereum hirsutum FP-91666 SS1]|uniref:uncharacterized protein n=1 Tax=Stereum hirsutum (strain FP-91666) TaxID=721885 RepID=UPI0004449F02|nr:uncharacterized protein STEHIDRAFT_142002 [Stereum hirsutum FP-91666 SS1]EIM82102.1 hypothetical protein STEHIDRAFT_142002 [Stereum hirsutum FP-91666 SS1]